MRKILGLTVIGFALHFVIALYTASQAFDSRVPLSLTKKLPVGKLNTQRHIQEIPKTEEDKHFRHVMDYARSQNLQARPTGEIMQAIAKQFLGTVYQADLLDQSKQETLVVSLQKFDCMLFVETVLALARGIKVKDYSYQTFVNHLQDERYQNGQINGYCSRLHYFSQWLFDNEKRGTVKTISPELGGIPLHKTLNFMSKHWQSYPRMHEQANYKCIVENEAKLDKVTLNYIPLTQIHRVYAQLQSGDIIAIATNTPGLDVTHTGLVYRYPSGGVGLIHASPRGDVKISPDLETFVGRVRESVGVIVARPIDPR